MPATAQPGPLGSPAVWDAIAAGYAEEVVPVFAGYAEEGLRLVAPARSARVLDVACGPGTLAFLAAPRVAHVQAIDFSPKMIDELRARAAREHVDNLDAAVMDAQSLTFADASFDAAFCFFAFMFFPDRGRAFREIRRVLRPGGKAMICTWAPIERRPFMRVALEAMAEALPEIPPMAKGDLQNAQECVDEMSAAGFRDVTVTPFSVSVRVDTAEHFLQIMERSGAGISLLKRRYGDGWPAAQAKLVEAIRRRIPQGGADLAAEALLSLAFA